MPNALGLEHAAIPQPRREDAGEAAGEGDDGDVRTAAGGDAQGPGPQFLRLRRAPAEDRARALNQEPAGARGAGLGDQPPALGLARAGLAGPAAEIGFERVGVAEARGAANQKQAAAELARVCRPGGRLSLAAWAPGGSVADFFSVIGRHRDAAPPAASPLAWGDEAHVQRLLGRDFDLQFEAGVSDAYHRPLLDDP